MKKTVLIIVSVIALYCVADLSLGLRYGFDQGTGDSMDTGTPDSGWYFTNPFDTPAAGDIVSFRCQNPDKCTKYQEILHRLVSTDPDGCMHIIGDNPKYNWDPNYCLYPDDIQMYGVSYPLPSIF
ncbi:MAG: hypothetical protein HGA33_03260 [Candidatus Moranbacteria bacterium]|nr:hypothetical protein [Candidatus Moranbacteria bacterium]